MSKGPRFSVGRDILLIVTVAIASAAVALWLVSARGIGDVGEFAASVNERNIGMLASQYLARSVRERAERYDVLFRSAQGQVESAAGMAALLLARADADAATSSALDTFAYDAHKGIFHNGAASRVSCAYWGGPILDSGIRDRIATLSLLDPLLESATLRLPCVAGAWILLESGILRYSPNIQLAERMPPVANFDYRDDHCYRIAHPDANPKGRTVWSEPYVDTVGQGLVVTVASPIHAGNGAFLGVAGMEFSLDGMVAEILRSSANWDDFGLLVDAAGRVLGVSSGRADLLGLDVERPQTLVPGAPLNVWLAQSHEPDVRAIAQDLRTPGSGVRTIVLRGERHLVAFHHMASTGWNYATVVPEATLLSSVTVTRAAMAETVRAALARHLLLAVGVGALTLALLLVFVGRRVLAPVRRLSAATKAVAAGDLESRITGFRDDEFGQLAQAFNAMTRDLGRSRDMLARAEAGYRSIFENAVEGIYQTSADGRFLSANPALANILGYDSPEQLVREVNHVGLQIYVDPADRDCFLERMRSGADFFCFEARLRRRDGAHIWARWHGRSILGPDGEIESFTGLLEDVTERRMAEERIHALNRELLLAQEHERKLVALHLHDNVAQNLSFLKIQALLIAESADGSDCDMDDFLRVLSETIDAVRNMAYELRPSGLDELGLARALELYCNEFAERSDVEVDFSAAGIEETGITSEMSIHSFRIVQEALRNVERHSGAGRVQVKLVASHPNLIMRIRDDGCGFDAEAQLKVAARSRRMGLQGMRERARLMGGDLRIVAGTGRGTSIVVECPLSGAWAPAAGQCAV
ncbi:PAS domain S-box-containing protein [Desulfobaculum xiamenense]|uniref:histidine kinase n=1 Tax=Desulfobaculum xiamenense TaxID=995050 RepID=A0A846QL95_9BACT|nr:PAS domain S-box protein [Desulfobaculum xiamenense]NJB68891.1 PAS domain S-box-containing protein [Desulfobaculum xiamenense]